MNEAHYFGAVGALAPAVSSSPCALLQQPGFMEPTSVRRSSLCTIRDIDRPVQRIQEQEKRERFLSHN